jgi:hypothetical protein
METQNEMSDVNEEEKQRQSLEEANPEWVCRANEVVNLKLGKLIEHALEIIFHL